MRWRGNLAFPSGSWRNNDGAKGMDAPSSVTRIADPMTDPLFAIPLPVSSIEMFIATEGLYTFSSCGSIEKVIYGGIVSVLDSECFCEERITLP